MKILKTSALAAVLALGSFAANASYDGSDSIVVQLNASSPISVTFDHTTHLYDDVIPADTLSGSTTVDISSDNASTIDCTLNGSAITTSTEVAFNLIRSSDSVVLAAMSANFDCTQGLDRVMNFSGTASANLEADETSSITLALAVTYTTGGNGATITGTNS